MTAEELDTDLDDVFDFDEDFDPLEVDDMDIDQEDIDDDNPYDTVDYPTMRNMPEEMDKHIVYTPEHLGGADKALLQMIDYNPARRPVLLEIIGMCEGGCASSEITRRVDELQEHNRSVYSAMTLCRMLERAGALELEMPETTDEAEDIEEGVQYLEIKERVDPIWHATDDALRVRTELMEGSIFRDLVLVQDRKYLEVYRAVMAAVAEAPRTRVEIDELADTFPVVAKPRRYGTHFIDILERADVLEWRDHAWTITELGRAMLVLADEELKGE